MKREGIRKTEENLKMQRKKSEERERKARQYIRVGMIEIDRLIDI